jgi:hypothetical protein
MLEIRKIKESKSLTCDESSYDQELEKSIPSPTHVELNCIVTQTVIKAYTPSVPFYLSPTSSKMSQSTTSKKEQR